MQGAALIINGTSDHVHMLVRIRPAQSAAEVARVLKANSSHWFLLKWKTDFAWQTGYGVFSVSESNISAVSRYCEPEGPSPEAFIQQELGGFLKKNWIP